MKSCSPTKEDIEQEILDTQYLDKHFSVIGATFSRTSVMQDYDDTYATKVTLPDAVRVLKYTVSSYLHKKGSTPMYNVYKPCIGEELS